MSRIFGSVNQICWVVPDIEASIRYWGTTLGIGPWALSSHVPVTGFVHAGVPSDVDMSIAIAYTGEMQIELIQQHNDAPSLYHDVAPGPRGSQHHLGYYALDYDARCAEVEAAGYEVGQRGTIGPVDFTYYRTDGHLGTYCELIRADPAIMEGLEGFKAAARAWDGKDLYLPSLVG